MKNLLKPTVLENPNKTHLAKDVRSGRYAGLHIGETVGEIREKLIQVNTARLSELASGKTLDDTIARVLLSPELASDSVLLALAANRVISDEVFTTLLARDNKVIKLRLAEYNSQKPDRLERLVARASASRDFEMFNMLLKSMRDYQLMPVVMRSAVPCIIEAGNENLDSHYVVEILENQARYVTPEESRQLIPRILKVNSNYDLCLSIAKDSGLPSAEVGELVVRPWINNSPNALRHIATRIQFSGNDIRSFFMGNAEYSELQPHFVREHAA